MRALVLVLPVVLLACGDDGAPARAATPSAPPAAASMGGAAPVPEGWIEETPSSAMRVAQFRLPGEGGTGNAELVVYAFPGGGGPADANLERWIGQVEQPDGRPSREVAEVAREELDGVTLHRVDVAGTYVAETSPGSGVRVNEPGWRLVAAVVEAPGGTRYVKCVGPAATVERWRASVDAYLRTVRP